MAERQTPMEVKLAARLAETGIDRASANAAILLATREYARPRSDLASTLQHYAQLETQGKADAAIGSLLALGFVKLEDTSAGNLIITPAADIREQIAARLHDPAVAQELLAMRRFNDDYLTVVGPLRDSYTYETYLDLLRSAQDEILMPIITTDPDGLEAVSILRERAKAGVKVNVLGASPKLVEKFRGGSNKANAAERIVQWNAIASATPNMGYRLTDNAHDLLYATSILIDRHVARIILYDPFHERSKNGLVVQVGTADHKQLNILRDFETRFRAAWRSGRAPGWHGRLTGLISNFWQASLALTFLSVAGLTGDSKGTVGDWLGSTLQPTIFNVAVSIGATFAVTAATQFIDKRRRSKDLLGKL